MSALEAIERGLYRLGYHREAIRHEYTFPDVLSPSGDTTSVVLAAFTKEPASFKSAAFGVVREQESDAGTRSAIATRRALGAPLFFSIDNDTVRVWRATASGDPLLLDRVNVEDLGGFFERKADQWSPQAIHRAKSLSPRQQQIQFDFVDLGLLPAIEREVQAKLAVVLDDVVRLLMDGGNNTGRERAAFRATFRLLAAKILQDRAHDHAQSWDKGDVLSVMKGIQAYYSLDKSPPDEPVIGAEHLANAWNRLLGSVSLRNISADSLAFIYENTLVTADTRKTFGTHSTPRWLADYVLDRIDISRFDLETLRIHEPFAGAGVFLVSALRHLQDFLPAEWTPKQRHDFLTARISGSEQDSFACEVAKLSLILADYPNANGWKVADRDLFQPGALAEAIRGATVVLCNPPFEDFTAEERQDYPETAPHCGFSKPRFVLNTVLEERPSALGFILPYNFIHKADYEKLRRKIEEAYQAVELVSLPEGVFLEAEYGSAALIATEPRRAAHSRGIRLRSVIVDKKDNDQFSRTSQGTATRQSIRLIDNGELWIGALDTLWTALADRPKLGELAEVRRGLRWHIQTENIEKEPREGFLPGVHRLNGVLKPFRLTPQSHWLNVTPEAQYYSSRVNFPWHEPKILINAKRRSRGRWLLTAAVDRSGLVASQQFLGIWIKKPGISLDSLSGILNGPLANAFIAERTTDQDIPISLLQMLPLPEHIDDTKLAAAVRAYSDALIVAEAESWPETSQNFLRDLLYTIDEMVFDGYGLSEDQRHALNEYFSGEQHPASHSVAPWAPSGPAQTADIKAARERARARGLRMAERDLAAAGGGITADQVASRLSLSLEAIEGLVRERLLIAVRAVDGKLLFPTAQFRDGQLIAGLDKVLSVFPDQNPWAQLNFLMNAYNRLGGARPIDLLYEGQINLVIQAAQTFGEQLAG